MCGSVGDRLGPCLLSAASIVVRLLGSGVRNVHLFLVLRLRLSLVLRRNRCSRFVLCRVVPVLVLLHPGLFVIGKLTRWVRMWTRRAWLALTSILMNLYFGHRLTC